MTYSVPQDLGNLYQRAFSDTERRWSVASYWLFPFSVVLYMKPRSLNDESESIWQGYTFQFGPLNITVPENCVELVGSSPNGNRMDLNFIRDWSRPKMMPKADTRFSCSWIVLMLLPIYLRSSAKLIASTQGSCNRFLWMVRAQRCMSYSDNQIIGLPVSP